MSKFETFKKGDPKAPVPNRHAQRLLEMTDEAEPSREMAQACIDMLKEQDFAPKSIATYYNAWKKWWADQGTPVHDWPQPPKLHRKIVPVLTREEALGCIAWMDNHSDARHRIKSAAVRLCLHAGLRIDVEALDKDSWYWIHNDPEQDYGLLQITGKGGHERQVVVTDELTRKIDKAPPCSYASVRRAWKSAVKDTAPDNPYVQRDNLPTLHSLRHVYARHVYDKTGDILTARDQLGHSSVTTTETYLRHSRLDKSVKQIVGGL